MEGGYMISPNACELVLRLLLWHIRRAINHVIAAFEKALSRSHIEGSGRHQTCIKDTLLLLLLLLLLILVLALLVLALLLLLPLLFSSQK
nr:unnamed protein product [Spirometra erinaceieuropaei]